LELLLPAEFAKPEISFYTPVGVTSFGTGYGDGYGYGYG
jgi:hypothetical protein